MVEFTSEADLVDWLNSCDLHQAICFRTREALRTLPDLGSRDWSNNLPENAANGSQRHLIPIRTLALPVMRAILIGAVGSMGSIAELRDQASDAGILSGLDAHDFSMTFFYAAEAAQVSAILVASEKASTSTVRAFSQFLGRSQSTEEALHISSIDADKIEDADSVSEVFDTALWPELGMPVKLEANLVGLRDFFKSDPKMWGFWERWYDGFLCGNPIDWDVQLAIAMLPNEDLDKGPEWIAGKTAEIETRVASEKRIAELEQALLSKNTQRRGIGGNHPPEPIDDVLPENTDVAPLREPLEELAGQTQSDLPNEGVVRKAVESLQRILSVSLKWTASLGDSVAQEAAKSIGKIAGPALLAWVASHVGLLEAVITAAKNWLHFCRDVNSSRLFVV